MIDQSETQAASITDISFDEGRRNILKLTSLGVAAIGVGVPLGSTVPASAQRTLAWDKTFPKSDRVESKKVSYYDRLGIELVADLYVPKDIDRSRRNAALIVGHRYGGVKEQTSGLYAQTMAERGFVTIAFDASYGGESGGEPHATASHEAYVDDFSASVDFLGKQSIIDREKNRGYRCLRQRRLCSRSRGD